MEIEIGPSPKYEDVRSHAYWTRAGIDSRLRIEDHNIETYKAHLRDCENNPTVGLLAQKKYITGKPMNYPESAIRNISYLKKQPEIDSLEKSVIHKIKTLYPRTKHIRKYIIDNNRVVLDGIEKIKKYTTFNKLKLTISKFR